MVIVECIRLNHNHIGQITAKRVTPQITDILRPFGIRRDIVPMVSNLYPYVPGAAMYRQPRFTLIVILAVLNEVVASAERAETFIKDYWCPLKLFSHHKN